MNLEQQVVSLEIAKRERFMPRILNKTYSVMPKETWETRFDKMMPKIELKYPSGVMEQLAVQMFVDAAKAFIAAERKAAVDEALSGLVPPTRESPDDYWNDCRTEVLARIEAKCKEMKI